MKTKKLIAILLCAGAIALVSWLLLGDGSLPGLEDTESLGRALGIWSLAPPVIAVALAFLTGDVILSLLAGVITGAAMLTAVAGDGILYGTFHRAVESIVDTFANR